jgi:hypothetical protein
VMLAAGKMAPGRIEQGQQRVDVFTKRDGEVHEQSTNHQEQASTPVCLVFHHQRHV